MVACGGSRMGHDIALNGVFGNLGVGVAALLTGFLIDQISWRAAFWIPGVVSVVIGLAYGWHFRDRVGMKNAASASIATRSAAHSHGTNAEWRVMLIRVTGIIFFTTAVSSIIFRCTTFALP